ncbi:outer membrane protein assembly factor BamB [Wenyingzhuangia heitensis]|uniref:Outer membrane protein assembly factor BamB n=1 Tax=Wenyingzhuangia heitensis TaxID=1487859 RepID=A0ABX0U7U3_9FLAO|nr:PQQ-binding-like beta-propeller repeat protein [Wenyingzhuangia heitensis]NIJ44910.1 outer membrane protein assembly factor BamB [Wenyingzhuangia heitensis]
MNKFVKYTGCFVALLFVACNTAQNSVTTVADGENQWPMSGGPNGSWKVKTDEHVPIKWSVRTGENIKWKTTLPEGGQSGIAVWKDKLFLTINPPNDHPKHAEIVKEYQKIKSIYQSNFECQVLVLEKKKDQQFKKYKQKLKPVAEAWKQELDKNAYYQHGSTLEKPEIEKNMLRKHKIGKEYEKVLKKYNAYVHQQSKDLKKDYVELERLRKLKNGGASSKDVVLLCLNSETGKLLWKKTVKGTIESQYNYGFSDATTPCPATDGKHVWAINASGGMACFTLDGNLVWERTWQPTIGRPFNKQFDSMLFEDLIFNVEPPVAGDTEREKGWNYLHAFDKKTGKRVWVTQQALTHYNTPILGETVDGEPAILIGRGGPHGVPERPVGLSLISLVKENQGTEIWNWEPVEQNNESGWGALSTQHWDSEKASWFYKGNDHATINTKTGELIAKKPLSLVNQYNFDKVKQSYSLEENVKIKGLQNQRHCNLSDEDNLFYMVRYNSYLAKHNVITGLNEHLEVPNDIDANGKYIYGHPQTNDGLNSKGQLNAADARTRGNGFQKCFLGSPTMINNYIYFTNAVGMVYVIDANTEKLDESALVAVNDLGESGKTWSVNSLSYANGKIYHRTMKEVICIE